MGGGLSTGDAILDAADLSAPGEAPADGPGDPLPPSTDAPPAGDTSPHPPDPAGRAWWWIALVVAVASGAAVAVWLSSDDDTPVARPREVTDVPAERPADVPAEAPADDGARVPAAPVPAPLDRALGVYVGAGQPDEVAAFEDWVGRDVEVVLDFLPAGWGAMDSADWHIEAWAGLDAQLVFSVPMLMRDSDTLAGGAAGEHDEAFRRLARQLVDGDQAQAILRPGWEFNGDWFRWSAIGDPGSFVAYWRRIVDVMRAVPGADFRFDWSASLGSTRLALEEAYPGDDYVDFVGMDVYDQVWGPLAANPESRWYHLLTQPYGLLWHRDFAARVGKPMSFPEWGVSIRDDGGGGGDNAYFVERMHQWIDTNDVAYAAYFQFDAPDGLHALGYGQFGQASAAFLEQFGAG